ncbi:MAG: hypothetical protein JST17_09570 [Bacteroidetes bacterium]|nr:hypothetical protein [Bacteroidota bacterium]MBS1931110.1 hypothetical protein [Bacteroidota bacterium]
MFNTPGIHAQQLKYSDGNNSWDADSLGNHRFIVQLSQSEFQKNNKIAHVIIPWRRRDFHPELKKIILADAATGKRVMNVFTKDMHRECGEIYFEPVSGAGTYYVYYMPYKNEGRSNYPKGVYLKPDSTASGEWLNSVRNENKFALAQATEYQSINAFNSFYPMEFIATAGEMKKLTGENSQTDFLVFPEDRLHSIRMKYDLPERWIKKGLLNSFTDTAKRNENFTFQLGVYALKDLEDVHVKFSDLKNTVGKIISSKNISCFNTDGINYDGSLFHTTVDVKKEEVQAMWCEIDVPEKLVPGLYSGKAIVQAKGSSAKEITINLFVKNEIANDKGISKLQKMTRLKWLDSKMAQENTVIPPYTALKVKDSVISLLGRKVILRNDGFPAQIQTFFTPEMTSVSTKPNNLFTEPLHFHFDHSAGNETLHWKSKGLIFTKKDPGTVTWKAINTSESLQMEVDGSLEFDGFMSYKVKVTALQDISLDGIEFHLPMQPESAKYFMGLGLKGGNRPDSIHWKWDVAHKNQDGAWIGNVNAGLQFSLRDENYIRPLNTNFYLQKPLLLPTSWGNDNKGGIDIFQKGKAVLVNAYSGSRMMKKGETLYYNFNLLITPFHTINTDFQWATRFYHKYDDLDTIKASGATVINIHHATPINPWINYPFIEWKKMKAYIDEAHQLGLKVKIYNTIRELSDRAYELFAIRSLGHEIYSPGKGGGFSWLQEHVGDDYLAGWFVPEIKDAALVNSGENRWHNYYVEGMNWLVNHVGIDGIYLDDVAFDRVTMKRIKRVLTQNGHPGIVDLHSANQYNKNDGFNNSANLYMEHFPYLNRLWFGEYFDYEHNGPDYFLTEISGIPFGLMGEMLQNGGNPWRGMIYGMTNRYPWTEDADPRPIWKAWNEFGMKGTEMIGYWSENCPVKTDNKNVLATVYKKNGAALISIASWADTTVNIHLVIDWKKLGIDISKATITAPGIKNFQPAHNFGLNDPIEMQKGKGWLLVIKEK